MKRAAVFQYSGKAPDSASPHANAPSGGLDTERSENGATRAFCRPEAANNAQSAMVTENGDSETRIIALKSGDLPHCATIGTIQETMREHQRYLQWALHPEVSEDVEFAGLDNEGDAVIVPDGWSKWN